VEFKKKQAEEAKKIKELADRAKKGPLGMLSSIKDCSFLFLGGSGIKKSK